MSPAPFITSVQIHNLKSHKDTTLYLSPLSIITGPNGAGKSAIADAITLGALGELPWLGKTGPALRKITGPDLTLSVALELSDVRKIRRTWKKTARGMTATEKPDGEAILPLYSLDSAAFMAAKPMQRAQIIAGRFGIGGEPQREIMQAVEKELSGLRLPKYPAADDFSEFVENVEAALSEELSEATATVKRMKSALEAMTALEDDTAAPVPLADIQAAQQRLGAAKAKVSEITAALENARRDHAEAMAAHANRPLAPEISERALREELAGLRAEIEKTDDKRKRAASNRESHARDLENIEKARARAVGIQMWLEQNPQTEAPTASEVPPGDLEALTTALRTAERELATAEADLAAREKSALAGEKCPCCGAARAAWDEQTVWDFEEGKAAALARAEKARTDHRRALGLWQEETARDSQRKAKADEIRAFQAKESERNQYTARAEETARLIESLEQRISTAPAFSQEEAELLASMIRDKDTVEASLAEWEEFNRPTGEPPENIAERIAALECEEVAAHEEAQNAAAAAEAIQAKAAAGAAAQASADNKAKAAKEYDEAAEAAKKWDAARETLREKAKAETLKIFGPLLELARPICAGMLPTPLDHKGLDFGRWEGPHFIPVDTFSGSQKAAAIAAITAALAAAGSGIVIIDEFNNLDSSKRQTFLGNLAAAIESGKIAQAILLDNHPDEYRLPDFGSQQKI